MSPYQLLKVASSTDLVASAISAVNSNLGAFMPVGIIVIGIIVAFWVIGGIIGFFKPKDAPTAGYGPSTEGNLRSHVDWELLEEMEGQYHGQDF